MNQSITTPLLPVFTSEDLPLQSSTSPWSTQAAFASTMQPWTKFDSDEVGIALCRSYPCDITDLERDLIPWNAPIFAIVNFLNSSLSTTDAEYSFAIFSQRTGNMKWIAMEQSRFTTFTAANIPLTSEESFVLTLELFTNGRVVRTMRHFTVASPPTLYAITSDLVSASASQRHLAITVNASSPMVNNSQLTYRYSMVGHPENTWSFTVAESSASFVEISAPTTRGFFIEVMVIDPFGSFTVCTSPDSTVATPFTAMCPAAINASLDSSATSIVSEVLDILSSGIELEPSILLPALDVIQANSSNEWAIEQLLSAFEDLILNSSGTGDMSQEVAVLAEFAAVADDSFQASDSGQNFTELIVIVGDKLTTSDVSDETVQSYVAVVDLYASSSVAQENAAAIDVVSSLDNALNSACIASQQGVVPEGGTALFNGSYVSLDCAKYDLMDGETVVVDAGGISVIGTTSTDGDDTATITVTNWYGFHENTTTPTGDIISNVHGVHVTSSGDDDDDDWNTDLEDGFTLAIDITAGSAMDANASLRSRVSCRYLAEDNGVWSSAGVYLVGLSVEPILDGDDGSSLELSALCKTAHLTLFTIECVLKNVLM